MNNESLIKKWLDNDLTTEELKEFQRLEEYESYMKLSEKAAYFKAPKFDSEVAYNELEKIIDQKRTKKRRLSSFKPFLKIAAALLIGFSVYSLFFMNNTTNVVSLASEKVKVNLPDGSIAQLNSMSELSYHKSNWNKKRTVKLEGEAFFKVAKGSQFDVQTSAGIVSVLGTQFNVKNRSDYFEVKCFEGKVNVLYNEQITELPAGKIIRIVKNVVSKGNTEKEKPTWIANLSSFKSVPYSEVLAEFERQYNVKIKADFDTDLLYTGVFAHQNYDLAIQSITLPLNLKHKNENNIITLQRIE